MPSPCISTVYDLGYWQRFFGGAVAVREALYFAATIACTVQLPAVFLIDVVATWQGTRGNAEGKVMAAAYATCWPPRKDHLCGAL